MLLTDLDSQAYPCEAFSDLYHQRWRIEEAFKRLKHRMALEAVSGLSQQALIIDVAAKVLADNLSSLLCAAAAAQHNFPARSRKCNRSYAAALLQLAIATQAFCQPTRATSCTSHRLVGSSRLPALITADLAPWMSSVRR